MAVPILIDDVLRGRFADCAEPLRAVRGHPNEIAGGDGMPAIAKTVDAAAGDHEQAVFHDVTFDHGKRGARFEGHGVDGEIEGGESGMRGRTWTEGSARRGCGVDWETLPKRGLGVLTLASD